MTSIRVVADGAVFRIEDEHGRRYALNSLDDDGCFEAENCMTTVGWEHLTSFGEREAERLAAVLRRERRAIERGEQCANDLSKAREVADKLAAGLAAFGDVTTAAREWLSRRYNV